MRGGSGIEANVLAAIVCTVLKVGGGNVETAVGFESVWWTVVITVTHKAVFGSGVTARFYVEEIVFCKDVLSVSG